MRVWILTVLVVMAACRAVLADSNNASGADDTFKVGGNEVMRLTTGRKVGIGGVVAPR